MDLLGSIGGYMLGGSTGFFILFVVPIILLVGILWVCKRYNFSLIPVDLQGKTPQPFKFPKLSREKQGRMYKWNVDYEDDEDLSGYPIRRSSTFDPANLYD